MKNASNNVHDYVNCTMSGVRSETKRNNIEYTFLERRLSPKTKILVVSECWQRGFLLPSAYTRNLSSRTTSVYYFRYDTASYEAAVFIIENGGLSGSCKSDRGIK